MAALVTAWIDFADTLLKKGHYVLLFCLCLSSLILVSIILTHTSAGPTYLTNVTSIKENCSLSDSTLSPESYPVQLSTTES